MTVWLAALLLGCAAEAPAPGDTAEGAYIAGVVTTVLGAGIDDAEVCVVQDEGLPCVATDDGAFLVEGLERDADITLSFTHDGYQPTDFPHYTGDEPVDWDRYLVTPGFMSLLLPSGTDIEAGKGHFGFYVYTNDDWDDRTKTEGVTFSVETSSGTEPVYLNSIGTADANLEATTSGGGGAVGNLDPGIYEASFVGPAGDCFRLNSWAFEPGEPVPFEVRADTVTFIFLVCPP